MARKVFISFHVDDQHARDLLAQQAKDERFDLEFYDYSVHEPFDDKWKTRCKERVKLTSATICLIGEKTYARDAVLWELETSYEMGHKVFGVRIYRDKEHIVPKPLRDHRSPVLHWNIRSIAAELEKP